MHICQYYYYHQYLQIFIISYRFLLLDELWYFSCPSCPKSREIASDHLKARNYELQVRLQALEARIQAVSLFEMIMR